MKLKIRDIVKIGQSVGDAFTGGAVSNILDVVKKSVNDPKDPTNSNAAQALAEMDEAQNQAILALHKRVEALEKKK